MTKQANVCVMLAVLTPAPMLDSDVADTGMD